MSRALTFQPAALAFQLERAVKELGEAEGRYQRVCDVDVHARKERDSILDAKESLVKAQARFDRVVEEIKSKECLFIYTMKQVDAVLVLLEKLDGRGRLRHVEVKCEDMFLTLEMGRALLNNGFKEMYELPPARRAA